MNKEKPLCQEGKSEEIAEDEYRELTERLAKPHIGTFASRVYQLILEASSVYKKPPSEISLQQFTDYVKANVPDYFLVVIPKSTLDVIVETLREFMKPRTHFKSRRRKKDIKVEAEPDISVSVLRLSHKKEGKSD